MSFWDNVKGGTAVVAPPQYQAAPVLPQTVLPGFYPVTPATPPAPPMDEVEERHRRKAPSSRSTLTCPNCFSGNVCKPSPNTMEQCYECGWNPRFEQTSGGVPTPGEPTHAARQVPTVGFNPKGPGYIVGTVTL